MLYVFCTAFQSPPKYGLLGTSAETVGLMISREILAIFAEVLVRGAFNLDSSFYRCGLNNGIRYVSSLRQVALLYIFHRRVSQMEAIRR